MTSARKFVPLKTWPTRDFAIPDVAGVNRAVAGSVSNQHLHRHVHPESDAVSYAVDLNFDGLGISDLFQINCYIGAVDGCRSPASFNSSSTGGNKGAGCRNGCSKSSYDLIFAVRATATALDAGRAV